MNKFILLLTTLAVVFLSACGATTFTRKTFVWEPFDARENRQQKDSVTVELKFVDELPPSFYATVAACDQLGRYVVDKKGAPLAEHIALATDDQVWQRAAITNGTQNVLRLNGVVIRLFDPAGGQFNILTKDDLRMELLSRRPCPSTQQALGVFAANAIFDRNIEIVPGTTSTFWVAFRPATRQMPGIWKLALYDVPVSLDAAGRPVRTTRFETRISVKEVIETFTQASLLDKPTLIERKVQSATDSQGLAPGAAPAPAVGPVPAPTAAGSAVESPAPRLIVSPTSTSQLSTAVIAQAQARLNALGLNAGVPDGMVGAKTRQAVLQFQRSRSLDTTGQLDQVTLKALGL